jgi:AcrR family transcriptional regulator
LAQVLKEEVERRIIDAALRVFADKGYAAATIGEIAEVGGVSTGNIYRYYENKAALFDSIVDDDFVRRFRAALRERIEAAAGIEDLDRLAPDAAWFVASEALLRFVFDNRLRVVILLGRAEGTRWEGIARETVDELVRLAIAHVRALRPGAKFDGPRRLVLVRIYEALVETSARILAEYEDEARIRDAVTSYTRYHLAGLRALFASAA